MNPFEYFLTSTDFLLLIANITEGTVEWESSQASVKPVFLLNEPYAKNNNIQLLIVFQLRPPASLCMEITPCTSLTTFYKLLEEPLMKQMILSYGMTILETNN